MNWHEVLIDFVLPALVAGVSLVITTLLRQAQAYLKRKEKTGLHYTAASIVIDAVNAALPEFLDAIRDGSITSEERGLIIAKARKIAEPRLRELSGFAVKRLGEWLDHELEIALGKLLNRVVLGHLEDTATIGPDDPATE